MRILNHWPATVVAENLYFLDNYALIAHDASINVGATAGMPEGFALTGSNVYNFTNIFETGTNVDPLGMNGGFPGLIPFHVNAAQGLTSEPDAKTLVSMTRMVAQDFSHNQVPGPMFQSFDHGNGGVWWVKMVNSVFERNTADNPQSRYQGPVFFWTDNIMIENSLFADNGNFEADTACEGGAIIVMPFSTLFHVKRSEFRGNRAMSGGALSFQGGGASAVVEQTTFLQNVATLSGAGIAFKPTGEMLLSSSDFIGNEVFRAVMPDTAQTVRVSTEASGAYEDSSVDRDRPLWFFGEACTNCRDDQKPLRQDGSVHHMDPPVVVNGNTSYKTKTLYSISVTLPWHRADTDYTWALSLSRTKW